MWNFYDELYIAIPSGILVEGCVVGDMWTTVRADGNIGIARTMGGKGVDKAALAQSMIGQPLREVANHLKWDSLVRASIGVAAMNAFYNKAEALADKAPCDKCCEEFAGKKVTVIGDACSCGTALALPESAELGAEYDEAMKADVVFISGDALINRTLPALLAKVGENTKVVLCGPGVPAAPVMFAFGNPVHALTGLYATIATTVEGAAILNIKDLAPGTAAFTVVPAKPAYVHEQPEVERYQGSPYSASKFNCAFNPWEGKDYNQGTWSDIYKS